MEDDSPNMRKNSVQFYAYLLQLMIEKEFSNPNNE